MIKKNGGNKCAGLKSRRSVKKGGIGSAEDAGVSAFFFGLFSILFFLDGLFIRAIAAETGKGNGSDQAGEH